MSSWETSGHWYHSLVGEEGHFYHQMILPRLLPLLNLRSDSSLLDLACGQAVVASVLPKEIPYMGIDLSETLIQEAKKRKRGNMEIKVGDICKPLSLQRKFSHATMILAAQNIESPELAFQQAANHLLSQGKFVLVLNHPCFRIPRQSHWGIDESKKLQYRRMDCYLSSQKIPIHTHPSKGSASPTTITFHHPLSKFTEWLYQAGFLMERMEEWVSEKVSSGKNAKMENRARNEFPLFLTIVSRKL